MEPPEYRIPPTHAVYPSPKGYEPTQAAPPPLWYDIPPIPPPPPPERRKHRWSIVGFIVLLLCLVGVAVFAEWASIHPASVRLTPTATQMIPSPTAPLTPTVNSNYTAVDIMQDFNAAGIHPSFVEYNKTIWSWTGDRYPVSVHATSSVNFTDDSGCTGPCSPGNVGVWVYSDNTTAQQASIEVSNDENQYGEIPMIGKPTEYVQGRCLLLDNTLKSIYRQVVARYCV